MLHIFLFLLDPMKAQKAFKMEMIDSMIFCWFALFWKQKNYEAEGAVEGGVCENWNTYTAHKAENEINK